MASWRAGAAAGPMRLIGVLTGVADDPIARARNAAFVQGLQELGWVDGRNIRIDYRWGGGDADISPPSDRTGRAHARCYFRQWWRLHRAAASVDPHCADSVCGLPDPVGSGLVFVCRGRAAMPPALCYLNTI